MRHSFLLALGALLASLAPVPGAAQGNTADADTREVQAYRLTMPKLKQLNEVFADLQRQRAADPAYQRLLKKKQELDALNEKDDLTDAELERIEQLEAEIAAAEEAEDMAQDEDESLSEMAERMVRDPRIAGALHRGGLAPREAATMQLALFQVGFAVAMLESGTINEIPKEINAENVKFYQANKTEILSLTALRDQEKQ